MTEGGTAVGTGDDVRSGAPIDQRPEQMSGREVAARSDLFAPG